MNEIRPGSKMLINTAHTIEERGNVYGHPLPNHERIARYWNATLADKLKPGSSITPGEVVHMMIGLKLARLLQTPNHFDTIQDICGYGACLLEIEDAKP